MADLATPRDSVWKRVSDVRRWPSLFSDMSAFSAVPTSADESRWTVRFESRTFGHGPHEYFVVLDPLGGSARIALDAPGVRAVAYASLGVRGGGETRASYALYVEKHGILGWFVSEPDLRVRQERLVERNLRDLAGAFGTR